MVKSRKSLLKEGSWDHPGIKILIPRVNTLLVDSLRDLSQCISHVLPFPISTKVEEGFALCGGGGGSFWSISLGGW